MKVYLPQEIPDVTAVLIGDNEMVLLQDLIAFAKRHKIICTKGVSSESIWVKKGANGECLPHTLARLREESAGGGAINLEKVVLNLEINPFR